MKFIKKLLLLTIGCVYSFGGYAEESPGGLLFTSSKEKVDKRTSFVLFDNNHQKFENSFTISFDLSIWDSSQFGHIFRIINKQKQEVEFVFVNFYGIDNMYLDFHSPITHESVKIPLSKDDIDKKENLHFDIFFDLKNDKADITFRNVVYTCNSVGLEDPSFLKFTFGLYGLNLDVPQMLIKNLRILTDKKKSYFFPLNESDGEFAYDETKKVKASVKNPEWIVNKHFYWQPQASFKIKDKVGITYDRNRNRILLVNDKEIQSYYLRYKNSVSDKFNKTHTVFAINDVIYNPNSNKCFVLNDSNTASIKDIKSDDLAIISIPISEERSSLHHSIFLSSSGDLFLFGGYANHSYSNEIFQYNKETLQWEYFPLTGDIIYPRFYSAIGEGLEEDEKLLFGGFGNETGKQEHGGHNFYDLYKLNLKQKTITRLWNLHKPPKLEFIPGNNLVLSKDKAHFYALCYAHHTPKTVGYLYRFSIQDGSYEIMSDSINFTSEDMSTSVHLFHNEQMTEFYAVVQELLDKDENLIHIYSLLSPPISKSSLESSSYQPQSIPLIILIILFVFAVTVSGYLLWRFFLTPRKENKKQEEIKQDLLSLRRKEQEKKEHKQSAIYIFGDFTVFDRKGADISYRFSMKMRTLFSIVLLNTDDEKGITTENLTLSLWPDKNLNEAKNIRGVTINRLRNILEDIDGIRLIHQNHQWFFVFEQPFYCDYLAYSDIILRLLSSEQELYVPLMEQLITILDNGGFLRSVNDSGIDTYKSKEEEKLAQLIKNYIIYLYGDKQYQKVISISSIFFDIEPLNEEILTFCIKSYRKLGKKEGAKTFYKNYKQTYKILTGEDYKGSV